VQAVTNQHEVAIRAAVDGLVAALLDAVRDETAPASVQVDRLLGIDEAAAVLGIGRTALYQELTAGRLRSFKVGRRRLVPTSAIGTYIEAGAVAQETDR
jgi:excisionase family DNA binding protein